MSGFGASLFIPEFWSPAPQDFLLGANGSDGSDGNDAVLMLHDEQALECYTNDLSVSAIAIDQPQDFLFSSIDDGTNLDDPSMTDWNDWSWAQAPPVPDIPQDFLFSSIEDGTNVFDDPAQTDWTDYGSQSDPLAPDLPQDFILGDGKGLDDQDFTDTWDYGERDNGPIPDPPAVFPLGDGSGLDFQDFTDDADYGFNDEFAVNNGVTAPDDQIYTSTEDGLNTVLMLWDETSLDVYISDGSDEFACATDQPQDFALGDGSGLDDQDWSDTDDYGFHDEQALALDVVAPDQIYVEDYSWADDADYADYSSQSDQAIPDLPADFALGDGSGLDDQDWSDTWDYGDASPPLSDDAPQDFLLGDGQGLDDQDWTDTDDYGFAAPPAIDDLPQDFALGIEAPLTDDDTFADNADYTFIDNPLSGDTTDFALSTIEDYSWADDTDYADYSSQSDPLSDDQPQDFILGIEAPLTDDDSFTDWTDYSFVDNPLGLDQAIDMPSAGEDYSTVDDTDYADYGFSDTQALADDLPQDFALGDGSGLDDQDFSDTWDYGTQCDPLSDDLPQDFALGDGAGLDAQDFNDDADYGFIDYQADEPDSPQDFALGQEDYSTTDDTDFTDYGFVNNPLADDLPQDFALGQEYPPTYDDAYLEWTDFGTTADQLLIDTVLIGTVTEGRMLWRIRYALARRERLARVEGSRHSIVARRNRLSSVSNPTTTYVRQSDGKHP